MRQVPACVQAHPEDGIARLQQGHVDGCIGLRAGVWLHVGIVRLEQRLRNIESTDVEHLITELAEDLWTYLDGEPPHDDVTLVAIRIDA